MKLLPAKLAIPEPHGQIILRPRLLNLCGGNRLPRLVVMLAAAGYGKSTLAAQLIGLAAPAHRAWYTLDRRDSEPEVFTAYLAYALSSVLPLLNRGAVSHEIIIDSPDAALDDICVALQEYDGPGIRIVLDNFESVADSRTVTALLRRLLHYAGPRLHVILTTRSRPDIGLSKMAERGDAIVLRQADLAFTRDETREAARHRVSKPLSDDELDDLWQHTGGWCIALGLRQQPSDLPPQVPRSDEAMADFVADEITAAHSTDFRDALMRTALLPELKTELCAALLGSESAGRTFTTTLAASSLPHVRLGRDHFRLHPVFREALITLRGREAGADAFADSVRAAVTALAEHHQVPEAVELCLTHDLHDRGLELIRDHWESLIEADRVAQVTEWLATIRPEREQSSVYIMLHADLLSLTGRNQELIDFLSSTYDPQAYAPDDAAAIKLWIRYNWARLHTSTEPLYERLCADWDALRQTHTPPTRELLGWGEYTLACAAYMETRLSLAERHVVKCLEFFPADALVARSNIRDQLAIFWHGKGRSHDALALLDEINREQGRASVFTGMAMRALYQAWINIALGNHREGLRLVEHGLDQMRAHEPFDLRVEMYADLYRGAACWYLGQADTGLAFLRKALAAAQEHNAQEAPYAAALLDFFETLTGSSVADVRPLAVAVDNRVTKSTLVTLAAETARALRHGDATKAFASAGRLLTLAREYELESWTVTGSLYMGAAAGATGDLVERDRLWATALATLARLQARSYPMNHPDITARAYVWAVARGDRLATAENLVAGDMAIGLTDAFQAGLQSSMSDATARARLLSAAAERGIRGLRTQAEALSGDGDPQLAQAAGAYLDRYAAMPLPPLHIQLLGGYAIEVSHRRVAHKRKNSERAMQILLLDHPRPVHEERLMECLWPEADPDSARAGLRTCIKDLRRDLDILYEPRGRSYVDYRDNHYALALPDGTTIDLARFRDIIRQANALDDHSDPGATRRVDLRRRALALYRGPLLPSAPYDDYAIDEREALAAEFLRCCADAARLLAASARHADAVPLLQRGLRTDPLWADGVQLLMETWVGLGRKVNALRVYREYEARLEKELQVRPDTALRSVIEDLVR